MRSSGFSATLLCATAALLVAIPSAGFALGVIGNTAPSLSFADGLGPFTPASSDPRLARLLAANSGDKDTMHFTPAGAANRSGRSVTVAVRVDAKTARAISVGSTLASINEPAASSVAVALAPTRYNLGLSRGYQSFVRTPESMPKLATKLSDAAIPDLATFQPSPGVKERPSRFNARIAVDEENTAGHAPGTRAALGDQTLDVGGSYSLTRNLNVTAGVRYSQDRDRIAPLADENQQDSQAVYVGTQFRF